MPTTENLRTISIASPFCSGEVQSLGGMAGPFTFRIGGDRLAQPFAVAPWSGDPSEKLATLPPLLQRLRGEWPCVPFGAVEPPPDLPPDWQAIVPANPDWNEHSHGFSSNRHWQVAQAGPGAARLSIDYPENHPVERLSRSVTCRADAPALDMALSVTARRDGPMPIGLHPVFRLPETPGAARLRLGDGTRCWSFPVDVEPGRSAALPDQRNVLPAALLGHDDTHLDITRLPFPQSSEDLILLTGTGGMVTLENHAEGYAVALRWDAGALPSCLLWISNRGRQFYPWNGRFLAIGIEPVAAPFDLGMGWADADSPLRRAGISTAVNLKAGSIWSTAYTIECSPLTPPASA
jgi:galactose mutarotase-like enzyme